MQNKTAFLSLSAFFLSLFLIFPLSAESGTVSVGFSALNQYAVADYANHVKATIGASLSSEYSFAPGAGPGLSFRLQGCSIVPSADYFESAWNAALLVGYFWNFPLPSDFSIQSALEIGLWIHGLTPTETEQFRSSISVYLDPAFQFSISLRWKKGRYSTDLAPVYTCLPEKGSILQLAGFRAGIIYSLN